MSFDLYPKSKSKKSGIYPYCKDCCKKRSKEWRKSNPEKEKAQVGNRRRKVRLLSWEYLREHPCIKCGESDVAVLQFHHTKDKEREVSSMISDCWAWEKILKEIEKCDILCANCHIKETIKQFNWYSYMPK